MDLKKWLILLLILALWCWFFYADFYFYKDLSTKSEIEDYLNWSHDIYWLFSFKKNFLTTSDQTFDSFIIKNDVEIPIQKLLYYQNEYWKIPNITCDSYTKVKLQRNYIVEPTYEDKQALLSWKKNNDWISWESVNNNTNVVSDAK